MTEVLFKGKSLIGNKWIEGSFVEEICQNSIVNTWIVLKHQNNDNLQKAMVDRHSICQFTGRYDKRNRKIFENDIVAMNLRISRNHYVQILGYIAYNEKTASYVAYFGLDIAISLSESEKFEVVGNRLDNPELLEGCEYNG